MTRKEETMLLASWKNWCVGKPASNQTYREFYYDVVRRSTLLRHINVFEVLDAVINAPGIDLQPAAARESA